MDGYTKRTAEIALGRQRAPLVMKNAKIVQVFTNEIVEGDIAIVDGSIVGVGQYNGIREINLEGKYVCPGFIDAHLHLESTLVRPKELILQAGLCGTTTFLIDPHEAANVSGKAGIDFILRETEEVAANVFVMLPSCVPAGPFEDNGATLSAADLAGYLEHPRVLGLGEVMDYGAVLSCDAEMLAKLALFREKNIDGHAGFLSEKETNCYVLAGIVTDHECCTFVDALREMRAGMQILIREGTAAKNLESIMQGIIANNLPCHQLAFCTDDKHIEEIQRQGHISFHVQKAIQMGLSPIEAIKIASFYPARRYGLTQLGAIAPGYQADFLVLSDLERVTIEAVYHKGIRIEKKEGMTQEIPKELLDTVHIKIGGIEELRLPLVGKRARVIEVVPGEILTKRRIAEVCVRDGCFVADAEYQKIVVLERHHATGKKGIGILKGFSIHGGAIASTVGHDAHNLIAVGDNDTDIYRAILALADCGGGYAVAESGEETQVLPLEIMGLISRDSHERVQERLTRMLVQARRMGIPEAIDPFITLSFFALPVIPEARMTARGLYDVVDGKFFGVEEE